MTYSFLHAGSRRPQTHWSSPSASGLTVASNYYYKFYSSSAFAADLVVCSGDSVSASVLIFFFPEGIDRPRYAPSPG